MLHFLTTHRQGLPRLQGDESSTTCAGGAGQQRGAKPQSHVLQQSAWWWQMRQSPEVPKPYRLTQYSATRSEAEPLVVADAAEA